DKFSRHLVVRLPGRALAGNGVAGALVAKMGPALQEAGLVLLKAGEPPGGATAPLVDPAVYSRTRHFRMLWCCKGGKSASLQPSARFALAHQQQAQQQQQQAQQQQAPPLPSLPLPLQQLFLSSLICNVHPAAELLTLPPGFMQGVQSLRSVPGSFCLPDGAAAGSAGSAATSDAAVLLAGSLVHPD
ncbi:hypothetical protein Agub_g3907, partial [Astrephomene gubernaculifera]